MSLLVISKMRRTKKGKYHTNMTRKLCFRSFSLFHPSPLHSKTRFHW